MTHERCDFCGDITTRHVPEGEGLGKKKNKIPVRLHFHNKTGGTVCLSCSGLTIEHWMECRAKTDRKLTYYGSLNAGWYIGREWPK